MRCPACGVQVPDDGAYCHRCGSSLEIETEGTPNGGEGNQRRRVPSRAASTDRERDNQDIELWQGTFSWKGMVGQFALGAIATVAIVIGAVLYAPPANAYLAVAGVIGAIWLGLFGLLFYRRLSVLYRISSQRFIHKTGILYRITDRVEMIDIDDVRLTEGLIERMLGTGTIYLRSSDRSHPELRLAGIDGARQIAGLIDDARRKERIRRGLHIEQI